MIIQKKSKRAQDEMVGFALIMIMVVVILVVFLGFSLRNSKKETVESYEVESFLQSFLQYTTDCSNDLEYLSVQKLISDCYDKEVCLDGRDTCKALDSTLDGIVKAGWKVGEDRPIRGYDLTILVNSEKMLTLKEGDVTNDYKGAIEPFARSGGEDYEISFQVYY